MVKAVRKLCRILMCGVFGSIICTAPSAAAEALPEYELAEYVVTAAKEETETKKLPMAAETISAEDMRRLGACSVQEALRLAVGLNVESSGMTGNQVQVRGMNTAHTLILLNGRRMAGENGGNSSINVYELNRVNIADVERIEIIRGSAAAVYGADAMGGVVNIITKQAGDGSGAYRLYGGSLSQGSAFSYASGREGKASFKIGGGLEEVRRQFTEYQSAGYGHVYSSNMHGPRRFLNLGTDYELGAGRGLSLEANFLREQFSSSGSTGLTGREEHAYDNNRADYSLTYYGRDGRNDYHLRVYYNILHKDETTATQGTFSDFAFNAYDTFVVEGKNSVRLDTRHTLAYGAEYTLLGMKGSYLGGSGSHPFSKTYLGAVREGSSREAETWSAYLQDEWQAGRKILLMPSLRYDHHGSFGGHLSPKIGLTGIFSGHSRIKLNYGMGLRTPTLYELYGQMTRNMGFMTVTVLGNDGLRPERATSFDVAVEAEQGRGSARVAYFHNDVRNLIDYAEYVYGYMPGSGMGITTRYLNVARAQISGAEAEMSYRLDAHWQVKAAYTYLDAAEKGGGRLNNRARHSGTVQLIYGNNKALPLTVTLWNRYYGQYLYNGHNYSYSTANITVHKKISKNLQAYCGVDNIFNKKFALDDEHLYSIYGRVWRVGAGVRV